mgnify:CR=1 FL=1
MLKNKNNFVIFPKKAIEIRKKWNNCSFILILMQLW